jgi:biotin carboxyl carrier protein
MTRRYQVTVGQRVLTVALREEGGALFARIDDGPERQVGLDAGGGTLRTLTNGDRHWEVLARRHGDAAVEVALHGRDYDVEVVDAARAQLTQFAGVRAIAHTRRELRAPMPGLVVRVSSQPGDSVSPGEALVVLQAMKMENELSLPTAGTVASVAVEVGQTVEQGQVLVVLE